MDDSDAADRPRTLSMALAGCAAAGVVAMLGVCGAGALSWRAFVSYGIADDMTEHDARIRSSDLPEADRTRVLGTIDRIREAARRRPIGFIAYMSYDTSLAKLAEDGITADELPAFEAELQRLEARMGGTR